MKRCGVNQRDNYDVERTENVLNVLNCLNVLNDSNKRRII